MKNTKKIKLTGFCTSLINISIRKRNFTGLCRVETGRLAVIVGPSGCGKTPLMRCIVGLEKVSEGTVFIDDECINEEEPKERDVAMVFQYYALYPHMTVRRNLSLGLEHTTRFTREQIQERVEEIAGILKISSLLERKPNQLSLSFI